MKSAFITGGSRGIGFAVAEELAKSGYNVAIAARSATELEEARGKLSRIAPKNSFLSFVCNVAQEDDVVSAFSQAVKSFGSIDVVFNNAGIYRMGSTELSLAEFDELIAINLRGAFTVAKVAVEQFRRQKAGYLINLASICSVHGYAGVGAYTASKFGFLGLNESLFRELAPEGIKVTAICPSWVATSINENAPFPADDMIKTSDMSKTVQYLLSLSANACPREVVVECLKSTL